MKPIKIILAYDEKNDKAIQAVLDAANGKATAHTYHSSIQIRDLAVAAEKQAHELLGNKRWLPGATYRSTSGDAVATAYKYGRTGTEVLLERRSSGWYLVEVRSAHLFATGGRSVLTFNRVQDEYAVQRFRRQYAVQADAEVQS